MSHFFEKGFSVREASWHGLATVLEEYPGREKAMELAGHNWNIIEVPVMSICKGTMVTTNDWKMLIRDDTMKPISVVTDSYGVVPNGKMWDIVDAIVEQPNVKYETAGVLKGGRILWILAKLDEPAEIPGDNSPIYPYVCVSTAHDGMKSCKAQAITVRVICWNTYQAAAAQSKSSGKEFTFRHTANVMDRIAEARCALGLVRDKFNEFIELAIDLTKVETTDDMIKDFTLSFIPDPPLNVMTDRVHNIIQNNRRMFGDILLGPTIPENHRHTAYGLFCAGTEFLDHFRAYRTTETYFKRTIFEPERLKPKLVELIWDVCEVS